MSNPTYVTFLLRNVLMLFALCNLTSFEAVSQQKYVFPYFDISLEQKQYVVQNWAPTGLTATTSNTRFAHTFNSQIRISDDPILWENVGGIVISNGYVNPVSQLSRFYVQDYTTRLGARTRFHDIAYVPKSALIKLYERISSDEKIQEELKKLTQSERDSIYNFMLEPNGKDFRDGLLIVVGDYESFPNNDPKSPCQEARTNAAIYVVNASDLQPIRFFQFFECHNSISTSSFTAIRYLDIVDRFVTVGSCVNSVNNNNIDILSFNGDLLYLAWGTLPGTVATTHSYNIRRPNAGSRESLQDIATGVDLRYFSKPAPPYYQVGNGAIMISGYTKNNQNEEKSFILRVAHNGAFVSGKVKNNTSNNHAHAVTFKTNSAIIDENDTEDLALTGFIGENDATNVYITKFDQDLNFIIDARYPRTGNNATEKPGFSIVSTGDGYAVTGRYEELPLNTNREHLSYLRVDNNLTLTEHSVFPFFTVPGSGGDSYGQRMRFLTGANFGLMLGGTKTSSFNQNCTCTSNDPTCNCTPPFPPPFCIGEWKKFTQSPLTLTQTNSSTQHCRPIIESQSVFCQSNDCWFKLNQCGLSSMEYDVCVTSLPKGTRAKLYELKGDNCFDNYCGQQ